MGALGTGLGTSWEGKAGTVLRENWFPAADAGREACWFPVGLEPADDGGNVYVDLWLLED